MEPVVDAVAVDGGRVVPAPRSEALPVADEVPTPPVADEDVADEDSEPLVGIEATSAAVEDASPDGLTAREREILAFERRWWKHAGAKEQAIRDAFDLSATRYYQLLNGLLDNPAALAAEPMLVGRLRRLRASRTRSRRR
ncbi:hypothetical protein GCM10027290_55610 [Micromonospora sonneratiae]|uniref:DUF3263 domain-containing protein n=1 Tax=Micromonospora sonneratiae TaxID=1184706 RepID=A0ABW3YJY0_9ACTN